jgi:hypothetical protein
VADAVSEQPAAQPSKREEQALVIARRRAEEKMPRHRFGVAYLALAALLGAAVGLFVVFATNGDNGGGQKWSTWKPTDTGVKKLNQIATHVADGYATASGRKLAVVFSTPPVAQGANQQAVPVRAIAVTPGLPGQSAADADIVDAAGTWAYILCGVGRNCSIPEAPTDARGELVQREALELALYTFKYESQIDSVLAYVPPAPTAPNGAQTNTMIFLRRGDLKTALDEPLSRTLSPTTGSLRPGKMSAHDLTSVRSLTNSRVFSYRTDMLQDGSPILVLEPNR